MVNKSATVVQVCEYFNGRQGNLPVVVNVQNIADYRAVLDCLTFERQIRVSSYIGNSPLPDTGAMLNEIILSDASSERIVALGLFQALAFIEGSAAIKNAIGRIGNCTHKLLVLTFGIKDIIEEKLKSDVRLKERAQIYFVNGDTDATPQIALTTYDLTSPNFYNNIKDYFLRIEEYGGGIGVVKSSLTEKAFENGIWSVSRPTSAFASLCALHESFAVLDESYGTTEHWEGLIKDSKGKSFKDILSPLGVDIVSAIKKFKVYNDIQRWYIFLWLRAEKHKGYIALVAQEINSHVDIISAVYNAILKIDISNKSFADYYAQRKDLIVAIDDAKAIREFVKLSNAKERNKVYYLTDATDVERKEIITCFTKYEYTLQEIRAITARIYPLLAEYLSSFAFNNEILDGYFEDYRFNKVRNVLTDKFKAKVDEYAVSRPFFEFQARSKVISKLDASEAVVYWIDALGVEFCAFINQRCKAYGLSPKIQIARTDKLPTLTKYNNDFSPLIVDKPIDKLDKIKHNGEGDYDYSKTTLPLYMESELSLIDEIIKDIQSTLVEKKKVIIVSDHGASRLVRIADSILTIAVDIKEGEKDEKHGGRCCAWNPSVPVQYKMVTDSDNNGFCVIANYDRFKGGRYTGVELHGGATLEEVVVPIIEITNKVTDYKFSLKNNGVLTLRGRQADSLVISLSSGVRIPKIRIKGQTTLLSPIKVDDTTYTFETNLMKSGKHECSFFDDNEEIIHSIGFEVKSALGAIDDLI